MTYLGILLSPSAALQHTPPLRRRILHTLHDASGQFPAVQTMRLRLTASTGWLPAHHVKQILKCKKPEECRVCPVGLLRGSRNCCDCSDVTKRFLIRKYEYNFTTRLGNTIPPYFILFPTGKYSDCGLLGWHTQNVAVHQRVKTELVCSALFAYIRGVLSSNVGHDIGYIDWKFRALIQSLKTNTGNVPRQDHDYRRGSDW